MKVDERAGGEGFPEGFVELPAAVYRDDPCWIPEDPAGVRAAFSSANPFFEAGGTRLFSVPGEARAAATFDPALRIEGEPVAFFGYFESRGAPASDAALFQRVEAWARERGARSLYGPINFNTALAYRLRLSAEPGALPFLGEPYNPPDYPARLEAQGYALNQRYLTQVLPVPAVQAALETQRPALDALLAEGYRMAPFDTDLWLARIGDFHALAHSIFRENFAYRPMSPEAFASLAGRPLLRKICAESSIVCFAPDGAVAGYALAYPHWGPLVVQAAGADRVALGDLDYARHIDALRRKPPVGAIGKTIGLHPDHRGRGLFQAMLLAGWDRSQSRYDLWYAALIREDNSSRRAFEFFQTAERWYGLYRKPLGP